MHRTGLIILSILTLIASAAHADVRLPAVLSSKMVLQRDTPLPFWGWADPGEEVTVRINQQAVKTKAGDDGTWKLTAKPLPAGGPYKILVQGKNTLAARRCTRGRSLGVFRSIQYGDVRLAFQ